MRFKEKTIEFMKLNGQGNDFIIIDSTARNIEINKALVKRMCDRNFGIGADGLILVKKSIEADFFMDYYNRDGTTAEMCGNGIRCMAEFIHLAGLSGSNEIKIGTRAGIKTVVFVNNSGIKVDMGPPVFDPGSIPVATGKNYEYDGFFVKDLKIQALTRDFYVNCLSMGNPHCIIILEEGQSLKDIPLSDWGPAIENHPSFPLKTNVEFVKIESNNTISMRVWERGVGETLACGTGACAAAVCAIMLGRIKSGAAVVNIPGGVLRIYWNNENISEKKNFYESVFLEGSVDFTFRGQY